MRQNAWNACGMRFFLISHLGDSGTIQTKIKMGIAGANAAANWNLQANLPI